jgi:hypothetical protein
MAACSHIFLRWRFAGEGQAGPPGPIFCAVGGGILKHFGFLSDDYRYPRSIAALCPWNRGAPTRQPLN